MATANTQMASEAPASGRSGLLAAHPWAGVLLLAVILTLNMVDRLLPSILAQPMKQELGLSDTFLGVLNGVGFLAVYAVAAIPIAKIADSGRYGLVITASLGVWSCMTSLGGLVATGWQLAATRVGVALGEAGATPAAHVYVTRNFAPSQRALALTVLSLGTPLGAMGALAAGGLLAELLGWRTTLLLVGAIGIVLTPIALLAIGPGRPLAVDGAAAPETKGFGAVAAELRKPTALAVFAGAGFVALAGYATGAFGPAYMMRAHGLSVGSAGLQIGLLNGSIGAIAMLGTGWLGGRLGKRDPRGPLLILVTSAIISIPFAAATYLVDSPRVALLCMAVAVSTSSLYVPLTVGCIHSLVPAAMRGRSSAVLQFFIAVFGGLGPVMVGAISDALTGAYGSAALGRGMMVTPAAYALAALSFIFACTTLRRDLRPVG